MIKEFYSNLVNTKQIVEVVVRGTKVVYYEATINMALGLHNVGDTWQHLLVTTNDQHLDTLMKSLCTLGTIWIDSGLSYPNFSSIIFLNSFAFFYPLHFSNKVNIKMKLKVSRLIIFIPFHCIF